MIQYNQRAGTDKNIRQSTSQLSKQEEGFRQLDIKILGRKEQCQSEIKKSPQNNIQTKDLMVQTKITNSKRKGAIVLVVLIIPLLLFIGALQQILIQQRGSRLTFEQSQNHKFKKNQRNLHKKQGPKESKSQIQQLQIGAEIQSIKTKSEKVYKNAQKPKIQLQQPKIIQKAATQLKIAADSSEQQKTTVLQVQDKKSQNQQTKEQLQNLRQNNLFQQQLEDSQLLYIEDQSDFVQEKAEKQKQQFKSPQDQNPKPVSSKDTQEWWPKPDTKYHIYSSSNQHFVWDISGKKDQLGRRDLLLNNWQNKWNQKVKFQALGQNKFRIFNLKRDKTMKANLSQCYNKNSSVFFSQISNKPDQIWELIPVTYFNGQNYTAKDQYFYMKSSCDRYLNYVDSPTKYKLLIQSQFNKRNHNNIWFLRENQKLYVQEKPTDVPSISKYYKYFTEIMQKLGDYDRLDHFLQSLRLQQLKMQISAKFNHLPEWMTKPTIEKDFRDFPPLPFSQSPQNSAKIPTRTKQFKSQISITNCPKNHVVGYIWYGTQRIPTEYSNILEQCAQNTRLLDEQDFIKYTSLWNQENPNLTIDAENFQTRQQINQLKLLYLYYESGIYADFDTQINEECFQDIITDQIIWTNHLSQGREEIWMPIAQILVPEQNFMMVLNKNNQQVKRMLQNQIKQARHLDGGGRWRQCKNRQCLIVNCQRHLRDNTYKKGFD